MPLAAIGARIIETHAVSSNTTTGQWAAIFHTAFLRMGGTGYQPVLVGNLPTRVRRTPCWDEDNRSREVW